MKKYKLIHRNGKIKFHGNFINEQEANDKLNQIKQNYE